MNYYMGFRRSMSGMARALEKIRFLSDQASRLHADTLRDLAALPRGEGCAHHMRAGHSGHHGAQGVGALRLPPDRLS